MTTSSYRMPAEWEPHRGTLLTWPHNPTDWPGRKAVIESVYVEIIRHLLPGEGIYLLVQNAQTERRARFCLQRAGLDSKNIEFIRLRTNRSWIRDYGPIGVRKGRKRVFMNFSFNGWGRFPRHEWDNRVPGKLEKALGDNVVDVEMVLEGGSIDVNGVGDVLTTEECLLDQRVQVRNPGWTREQVEATLKQSLGVTQIHWLNCGLDGDDTHGHVDDLCRFVDPATVVLAATSNTKDPNYHVLEENAERLTGIQTKSGKLALLRLPLPEAVWDGGHRWPASYANFYIGNGVVLVPTFNDPNDRVALGILSDCFPDRTVVGVHARELIVGSGAIHCITQQVIM